MTAQRQAPASNNPTHFFITDLKAFLRDDKKRFTKQFTMQSRSESTLDDYEFLALVGSGSFGKVVLANLRRQKEKVYAIKIIDKHHIVKLRQIANTLNEKRILATGNFPFLLHMESFIMDNSYLYFVLPFMAGGDLFELMKAVNGRFNERNATFYASQICLAIEYLHFMDVAHRDIKPENILIDQTGYIKLSDFGFSKLITGRTSSLCGTPDYLAPEILMSSGYGKAVDWWSFGVFIYEINYGVPPFFDKDEMRRYKKITNCKYHIPSSFSQQLVDLIAHLLEKDLSKRFGNLLHGPDDIKQHPWFKEINWLSTLNQFVDPPFKPHTPHLKHQQFTRHNLYVSPVDPYETEFRNF